MIIILSPAKNLDFGSAIKPVQHTLPAFTEKSVVLAEELKKYSPEKLQKLMGISPKLAILNWERFQNWTKDFDPSHARQAILAFNGEVYNGLRAGNLSEDSLYYAQDHLRILSGLYGVLRPLDLIQPYRLEMGTALRIGKHKDLYSFWGRDILTDLNGLKKELKSDILINLASQEYARAALTDQFDGRVITPVFKQLKGERLTTITIFMKKARGLMTRFILENRIEDPEELKLFDQEGYFFDANMSNETKWYFIR